MKILLIEDNKDISDSLAEFLRLKGHDCTISNDGKDGLKQILSKNYDVVLLDLSIPKFSGHQIIESLEEKGELEDQKIIILTASSLPESEKEDLINKGVISCLQKPIKLKTLLKTIQLSAES